MHRLGQGLHSLVLDPLQHNTDCIAQCRFSLMPSPAQVRALYKAFLREGQKYPNYNVREFVKRRAKQDFRQHAAETNAARIDQLWSKAQEDFAVTQRQRMVYSMYAPKQKSVMDIPMVKVLQKQTEAQEELLSQSGS